MIEHAGGTPGVVASRRRGPGLRRIDRLIKRLFGNFKGRNLLISAFLLLLLLVVAITSWLLYASAQRDLETLLEEVSTRIQEEVHRETRRFLKMPDILNARTLTAITSERVTDTDPASLHRLFWDAPQVGGSTVSGIYFAAVDGSFSGIDAVSATWPATEWRYSVSSQETGGKLVYYGTDRNGNLSGLSTEAGIYDPKTRPWYTIAVAVNGLPAWSEVYSNFDNGKATITRAQALYDERGNLQGVAGVDLFLDHLHDFISGLDVGPNGAIFLVDRASQLLGAYSATESDVGIEVLGPAVESDHRFVRAAALHAEAMHGGFHRIGEGMAMHDRLDDAEGYLSIQPIVPEHGLDWYIGVFVPESDHVQPLSALLWRVVPLAILAFLVAMLAFAVFVSLIVRPLAQLRNAASRIAVGEFDIPIDTSCGNEVGDLARSIDDMRHRLKGNFHELAGQKLLAETTLESITDGVITISQAGTIQYMNSVAERLTGTSMADARGQPIARVFRAQEERSGAPLTRSLILRSMADAHAFGQAVRLTDSSGDEHSVQCRVSPISDENGQVHGAVLNFTDLTEELRLRTELVHQATHDALTNLYNRREFERRLGRAVDQARHGQGDHVLCYFDVYRLRDINDKSGHSAGDELLRQLARLFEGSARSGDTLARIDGDEFALLLEQCTMSKARVIVDTLLKATAEYRFLWDEHNHNIDISIGLVAIDAETESVGMAMRDADTACVIAHERGRNCVHVHADDDDRLARLRGDQAWIERIEEAFVEGRFHLLAQRIDIANPRSGPYRHVELLLRMQGRNDDEVVSPGAFLPAAERYNLAGRVDRWVVSEAFHWLSSLSSGRGAPDVCAINLSGQSLGDESFLAFVIEQMRNNGIDPKRLCFEVTETAAIENLSTALAMMETLRELGCTFALDDFGSGLSSFAYLKTLPVDYLKIDGVFVRDMLDDPLDLAMVRSINEVGQTMGMRTIAEYVENDALRQALQDVGVDYVQGYSIGRPQALDTLDFDSPLGLMASGDGR